MTKEQFEAAIAQHNRLKETMAYREAINKTLELLPTMGYTQNDFNSLINHLLKCYREGTYLLLRDSIVKGLKMGLDECDDQLSMVRTTIDRI